MIRTENKRWFMVPEKRVKVYDTFSPRSERGRILVVVDACPGVLTHHLIEALPEENRERAPSRIAELERTGYLRSEFVADLFK
jgi:hypothetical protein